MLFSFTALKEAFELFDKNGNGSICTEELGAVLRAVGQNPTQKEIEELQKTPAPDDTEVVTAEETVTETPEEETVTTETETVVEKLLRKLLLNLQD